MKVFARIQDSREHHDAEWRQSKVEMAEWLADPRFRRKARRATRIWRGIGWALVAGPLAVRFLGLPLPADFALVDSWPVQDLAAFGFAYAATWRFGAEMLHSRIRREPMHLFGYRGILGHERWFHLIPGSRGVNKLEYRLRGGKAQKRPRRYRGRFFRHIRAVASLVSRFWRAYHWAYFRRTVVAALIARFWWVAVVLVAATWTEGVLATHMTWGWALWHPGASNVLTWFEMAGHRV